MSSSSLLSLSSSISIARALIEIKTLDLRINKIITNTPWIILKTKNKNSNVSEDELKKTIEYKKRLVENLKKQRQIVTIEYESHKQRVQNKIDENIKVICSKDIKLDETLIKSVSDGITKCDPIEIYDPLGLDKIIKEMETSIENFIANIDFVLSESNAITNINV